VDPKLKAIVDAKNEIILEKRKLKWQKMLERNRGIFPDLTPKGNNNIIFKSVYMISQCY